VSTVRFGIVGVGNMGVGHAIYFKNLQNATLAAICDIDKTRAEATAQRYQVPAFTSHQAMIVSKQVDALLIATPHYDHEPITIDALEAGLHVLVEKPLAVTTKQGHHMVQAANKHPELKFGIMLQLRAFPIYKKLRELIAAGELGEITRITWLITDWFRTWTYYASGGWRATWKGEGGGVLLNQCPHNLDLIQWLTGLMPQRITAIGTIGKRHPIEVEDEVSAILEYSNGAIGHFITTTGEAPGTNRLEIAGDRGIVVAENGRLHFRRTRESVTDVLKTSPLSFPSPETWDFDVPIQGVPEGHQAITQNFINAVVRGDSLIAPGVEGIHGLEIGNAMLMAALTRQAVELPVNPDAYEAFIAQMIQKHGGQKSLQTRPDQAPSAIGASGKPI
jgi:predicted dehydrogenase